MEPKVKVTEKIRECLRDYLAESKTGPEVKEIESLLNEEKEPHIPFRLLKHTYTSVKKKGLYLNEILDGSDLYLPEYNPPPKNPELEARLERLRAQQANREYREMVKNVDKREHLQSENIGKELKAINSQMMAVFNFIITVGGAFAFGYKATEYTIGSSSSAFTMQLMNGLILGTVVFFADLYFLVKQTL